MALIKRTARDVQVMMSDEMRSLDIYYWYDEADITTGLGLLFGPESTPYAFCPLIFSVKIPTDYPFNPPNILILTSDATTRFHPNLYVTGKVCLSILGTYLGPKWASTMGLGTIFKSIFSILNDNPIINEPGWEKYTLEDSKAKNYAEWVEFNLLKLTVHQYRTFLVGMNPNWLRFKDIFESEEWKTKWLKIGEILKARTIVGDKIYSDIPYGMSGMTRWQILLNEFLNISNSDQTNQTKIG